jgi:hypothetical protein
VVLRPELVRKRSGAGCCALSWSASGVVRCENETKRCTSAAANRQEVLCWSESCSDTAGAVAGRVPRVLQQKGLRRLGAEAQMTTALEVVATTGRLSRRAPTP